MLIMEEDKKTQNKKADIRIIGVGGGGSNAIETMIQEGIQGVQFIAVNTDNQALERSSADIKIQLGSKLTKGLGAGANPEIGRRAAVESYEEIVRNLQGADMVFGTAGMGGGTGTGGAPLVAQAAEELGLLTVGIVTKPFIFEGCKRIKQAEKGIRELRNYVDTLIVIPNEKLLKISGKDTPLLETFKITDDVLLQAVKGIAELVSVPGLINLDFADIKTVMKDKGMALMGRGVAEGADRAKKAIHSAVSSPFLEGVSIKGATGMIVNITANSSLSLIEVQEASSVLTQIAENEADVIIGAVIDENMGEKLSITVIATGFQHNEKTNNVIFPYKRDKENEQKNSDVLQTQPVQLEDQKSPDETEEKPSGSEGNEAIKDHNFSEQEETSSLSSAAQNVIDYEMENDNSKQSVLSPEETNNQKQSSLNSKETDNASSKNKAKLSPREILLSKIKDYEAQKKKNAAVKPENQMSMNWQETQLEDYPSSPFESSVDFSDEDML